MVPVRRSVLRLICHVVLLVGTTLCSGLIAQESGSSTAADTATASATPSAQPESEGGAVRGLEFTSLTRTSQGRARVGSLVVLKATVRNASEQSAQGVLVSQLSGQAGDEFRRSFTLNAREEKSFHLAVRVPDQASTPNVDVAVTLNVLEGGREVMLMRRPDEPATQTLQFPLVTNEMMTALAMDDEPPAKAYWRWPKTERYSTYELAVTTRVEASMSRICAMFDDGPFPLNMSDWDSIDVLIVSAPRVFNDATAIAAMQQFIQRGGRVWIMLDRIETSAVRELLVGGQECETVDVVELNHFEVDVAGSSYAAEDRTVDRDQPVSLKRVMQHGGRVTHSVEGWPIAIWYPIGSGELLLTTLASDAWLIPNSTHRSPNPTYQSNFKLPLWAATFASSVQTKKEAQPLVADDVAYPLELIGNPVVSFQLVGLMLLGFCSVLIAIGLWRIFSARDLSWMGGLAPALALAACGPLIAVAMGIRTDIPDMVTRLQLIQLGQHGGGTLREFAAVYSSANQAMKLTSKADGIVKPASSMDSGVRQTTVDDFQSWSLSNQNWPTGTWRYETEISLNQAAVNATGELTASGLMIELPQNLPSPLKDVVVNFVPGQTSLGKLSQQNQRLLIDGEFDAAGERWTTDTIVSDEQHRRAEVYGALFSRQAKQPRHPLRMLYGWTDMWEASPQWDVPLEQRGSALVSLPITLSTPKVGTEVFLPHSLVRIEPSAYAEGMSSIYSFSTGKWTEESTFSTKASLSFVLPPEAVPLEASAVTFEWDVKAPKRTVRLLNHSPEGLRELVTLQEPSIPWQATFKDPQLLEDLRDGRLELQIDIDDREGLADSDRSTFVSWRIKQLHISVTGRTLPRDSLSQAPVAPPSQ